MPKSTIPGTNVTVYSGDPSRGITSEQEAIADGKIDHVEQGADGNLYATPHQGWLLRNMPWLVLGTMAAGAGAAAAGVGATSAPIDFTGATGVIEGAGAAGLPPLGAATAGGGVLAQLKHLVTTPKGIATLAALVPSLSSLTGKGPFSGSSTPPPAPYVPKPPQMAQGSAGPGSPNYDALVNMAYGMTPTRYRGAPPAGYPDTASAPAAGPYDYQGPRFS